MGEKIPREDGWKNTRCSVAGRLQVLSLERNLIREVPAAISRLTELTTLSLAGNDSVAAVPAAVGELARLRRLALRSTGVRALPGAVRDLRRRRTTIDLDDDDDDDDDRASPAAAAATTEHVAD